MNYKTETTDDFNKDIKRLSKKFSSIKSDFQAILDNLERISTC